MERPEHYPEPETRGARRHEPRHERRPGRRGEVAPHADAAALDAPGRVYWVERQAIRLRRLRWTSAPAARDDARAAPASLAPFARPHDEDSPGERNRLLKWMGVLRGTAPAPEAVAPDADADAGGEDVTNLVGLALSGGGIRSASFNLGVMQGLASRGVLHTFDYLSTVSGGGFIGSWWSAWLSRERRDGVIFPMSEELELQRRSATARLLEREPAAGGARVAPDGSLAARREDPIHFVRLFSNYLTPKKGAFSPDTWRMIAFYVRNLVFTWLALLPLLFAAVLAAQAFFLTDSRSAGELLGPAAGALHGAYTDRLAHLMHPVLLLLTAYAVWALLWLAHASARLWLALAAFAVLGGVVWRFAQLVPGDGGPPWTYLAAALVPVAIHAWQALRENTRRRTADAGRVYATRADHRGWLTKQQAWLLKVGTFGGALLLVAGFGHDLVMLAFSQVASAVTRAGGWGAALLTVASAAYTAYKSAPTAAGASPEPPGIVGRAIMTVAPLLVFLALTLGFAFAGREVLAWTHHTTIRPELLQALAVSLLFVAWLELGFGIWESLQDPDTPRAPSSGWRRFVPLFLSGLSRPAAGTGGREPWWQLFSPNGWVRMGVLGCLALLWWIVPAGHLWPPAGGLESRLGAGGLVLAIAMIITFVPPPMSLDSARPAGLLVVASFTATLGLALGPGAQPLFVALVLIALLVGCVIGVGWLADPNLLSMHGFYKARLTRAYLGASNTARANDDITDAAPGDDVRLSAVWNHDSGGPYHLVNTTLNLVGGSDLAMSQRNAENFVMSRYHCGSPRTGYRLTDDYMDGELSLGTAAAISGAAVSPTMGSKTPSAALTLLLSLLNVRLGFWAPNPSGRRWREAHARLWPFYILRETLANSGRLGAYCYLTDGGHFDNTGLYALVERGCRLIVLSDCGADPALGFEDIGVAIRRCRIDFGAEIALGIDAFQLSAKNLAERHVVLGKITYHDDHLRLLGLPATERHGDIVWIKPGVTDRDAADVRQYRLASPDFPQQSTADQWYDESQFESYRRLGYESAREAVDAGAFAPSDALAPLGGAGLAATGG